MIVKKDILIEEIAYHRNGIGGMGFYVVLFKWNDPDIKIKPIHRNMIAVVFPDYDEGAALNINGRIAVLDRDMIPDIKFTENSWRGSDHFGPLLISAN